MDASASHESEVRADIPAGVVPLVIGTMELRGSRGRRTLRGSFADDRMIDLVIGTAAIAGGLGMRAITAVRVVANPVLRVAIHPPLVPQHLRPGRVIETLERRGRLERINGERAIQRILEILVPAFVEQLLDRIDVNALVKQHLDVEAIVADMDLDAVVDRVDVDRVASRLDVDAVLDRIDLTAIVRERVDLDAIVSDITIDTIVSRVDINTVLDRIDLTAIVRERVDLDAIVADVNIDNVASRLDVDAVIDRLDLPALAEQVIVAIDLPEIIRDSTGAMASEAVRGVRIQSIEADEAVSRTLDRIFRRRRQQSGMPHGATSASDDKPRIGHGSGP
jgi:hypothetical protein